MSDEKTEWVTIKIPDKTRQKAKEDDRTYGDIMEAGLEVPQDDLKKYEEFVDVVEQAIHDADVDGVGLDELEDRIVVRMAREYEADLEAFESKLESPVTLEATEYKRIAEEVENRLR